MTTEIESPRNLITPFSLFSLISLILVVGANFYLLYFKKGYEFIVEVPCDPLQEQCTQRDCEEGYCPPNELSTFKRYSINAADFQLCASEDCSMACSSGSIECEPLQCEEDIDYGESCSLIHNDLADPEPTETE